MFMSIWSLAVLTQSFQLPSTFTGLNIKDVTGRPLFSISSSSSMYSSSAVNSSAVFILFPPSCAQRRCCCDLYVPATAGHLGVMLCHQRLEILSLPEFLPTFFADARVAQEFAQRRRRAIPAVQPRRKPSISCRLPCVLFCVGFGLCNTGRYHADILVHGIGKPFKQVLAEHLRRGE